MEPYDGDGAGIMSGQRYGSSLNFSRILNIQIHVQVKEDDKMVEEFELQSNQE